MGLIRRRWLVVAAGVAMASCLLASPVSASTPTAVDAGTPSESPGSLDAVRPGGQRLDFGPCEDQALVEAGAECSTVAVPLDHRDPNGTTIDVAVSRLAARDSAQRRGVLLVNPGGPGSPGLTYPVQLRSALGAVADQYDLIGFDPRFAGLSSPITCGPTRFSDTFRSAGQDRAGFRESSELAADFARRCHDRHADVLPYGGTPDAARDMDRIRSALGEARISYFGVSWGAHLGAVYSQLFPDRVDRMVLDSLGGEGLTHQALRDQGPAAEAALDEWAHWTAERDDEYRLGATDAAVRTAVEDLVTHVARRPITIEVDGEAGPQTHRIDDNTLPLLLQRWLNHEDDDASLAGAVRDLVDAAAGQPVTPSPELAERLGFFDAQIPLLDNGMAAAWANICNEASWPSGARPYWHQVQHSRRTQPLFGPLANNVKPCAFWPATSTEPPVVVGNAVPILMVHAERDNTTLLTGARRLHESLTGSRLITADVRAHGAYGRGAEGYTPIPCIDRVVDDYLADGTLPPEDTSCG